MVNGAERFQVIAVNEHERTESESDPVIVPAVVGGVLFLLSKGAVEPGDWRPHLLPFLVSGR